MDRQYLTEMAKCLEARLPDNHGFILLTFQFGESGRMHYTANCGRPEAIKALKEFLFHIGEGENWMQHIK